MKISHIVSTDLLSMIEGRDFYMCLANIAYKNDTYASFYRRQRERGAFVLLDNGAAEHDQMTLDIMLEVINKVNPNEVILNDSLLNKDDTIIKSKEALDFYKRNGVNDVQFMFVPQGKNIDEWKECVSEMDLSDISTIGVSKFCSSGWKDNEARFKCLLTLEDLNINKDVHLLGAHVNAYEVVKLALQFDFVRSNDTALAFIYAQSYNNIDNGFDRPKGEIDFIDSHFNQLQKYILETNIIKFDKLSTNIYDKLI